MNSQYAEQIDATGKPTSAPPQAAAPLGLLSDPTAAAIHDAFLMGWSLQELKSRILIDALNLNASVPTSDSAHATGSLMRSSTTLPLPFSIVGTLQEIFQSPSPTTSPSQGPRVKLNNSIAQTSEWRAIFNHIAVVHAQCFPASSTEHTLYNPSPQEPLQSRFSSLYPSSSNDPDYALIGIGHSASFDDKNLETFNLYDVTRRALNCLTILYTKQTESLIGDVINDYQTRIVQSVLNLHTSIQAPNDGEAPVETTQEAPNQEAEKAFQDASDEVLSRPTQEDLDEAIRALSLLTVRFLESWDGYVRENFYAGGRLKDNEFELIAYEAGRALSSLSWNTSLMLVPLEDALEQKTDAADSQAQLSSTWKNVFQDHHLNTIKRHISALGPVLDDAYYRVNEKVQRPKAGEQPNLELPSRAFQALTYSLVYWQRAVESLCKPHSANTTLSTTTTEGASETTITSATISTPPANATLSTTTTKAVSATTITNATVSTPPASGAAQSLTLTPELSRQLRRALIDQAGIWQSLMLCEQNLKSFTTESVTKKILNNVMVEFEQTAKTTLLHPAQQQLKKFWTPTIILAVLLLVILVGGGIFLLLAGQQSSLAAVFTLLAGSIVTLFGASVTKGSSLVSRASDEPSPSTSTAPNTSDMIEHLSSLFGLAEQKLATAYQDAYKQIRIEFDDLNHYVAISYPLIDCFILNSHHLGEEIKDSYIFLTEIVWTNDEQKAEIERVARAAFGAFSPIIR